MNHTQCTGRGDHDNHCCYLHGKVCDFLETNNVPGRNYVCGLRRELGSWDAVNADSRYQPIGEHWAKWNHPFNYCETWQPADGVCCRKVGG